ncbi:hypothetical protein [Halomarina litorea]|uniref:hypothetical protein n=1 Tax=Halomarina litorea TaxID=2961595 RepID=UPI0020C4058F|nr:hypothetical protein [Halomarina sp. BCD28]
MRLTLPTTDEGRSRTTRLGGRFDGEPWSVRVHATGTTDEVPEDLGEYILESDRYPGVERYDAPPTDEDTLDEEDD